MKKLHFFKTAADFLGTSEPDLERDESCNNLLLGLAYSLVKNPRKYGSDPFFAIVKNKGRLELFALMTPPYKLILSALSDSANDSYNLLASHFISKQWNIPGVVGPESVAGTFANVYSSMKGCNLKLSMKMRMYQLTDVGEPRNPKGSFRPAEEKDIPLLRKWIDEFHIDVFKGEKNVIKDDAAELIRNGDLYVWDNCRIVSMVCRTRPTKHGYIIALVYTPLELRNKGYATAVVSSLCRYLLNSGKTYCALFADLSNPTSNSIYQKIGFKPIRDYNDYSFEFKKK
jgi:predicted GNAT family acetyltransferase